MSDQNVHSINRVPLEVVGQRAYGLMEDHAHVLNGGTGVLRIELEVLEEARCDALECVGGPLGEPVDGGAVDQRRELPQTLPERISDWPSMTETTGGVQRFRDTTQDRDLKDLNRQT